MCNSADIKLVAFPSPHNWPIWAAQEKGYFKQHNISVSVSATANSTLQLTGLIDGKFDIALTGFDNVVAYSVGQGEATTQQAPDIFAFMSAGTDGFLNLVTQPTVRNYLDLRGKRLSVDALTTGYAFVLQEMLSKGGLSPEEVQLVSVGGLQERFQSLMQGNEAGTLLISPMHDVAQVKGFNILGKADDVIGSYQGTVFAARRGWARQNKVAIKGYIRGYLTALSWLYDPVNKGDAMAILRNSMPGVQGDFYEMSYRILLDQEHGINRDGHFTFEGMETVLSLRRKYGDHSKHLGEARNYYDTTYLS